MLETLVFYEVLGGVRGWRAGRAVLGGGPGGPPGPPGGPPQEAQEALWGSAVGRKGRPKRAPYCRDSLFSRVALLFSRVALFVFSSGLLFRCPKGVLGAPLGSSCARPGAPRRAHRTVAIGCFWGLSGALWGALVGSRAVSSLFFWALSLMNSRWAREVELQTPVWVVCSKP